ncbi:MAG TPA: hypothetical protein VFN98_01790 [Nitrososphaeraceae archaeon]|nr:hypothetical protein [Nitrososphaeraceae archaeon]
MSVTSKTISLRVPVNIVFRALKDTRLEKIYPEFFVGITRKLSTDKENKELEFKTTIHESPIRIVEKFRLTISRYTSTEVEYVTETNVEEDDIVVQSIVQTHIANIIYSLLMLETGYINGLIEKRK